MQNCPVIDFHAHVGSWPQYGMDANLAGMVRAMDLAGVDQACIFNIFYGEANLCNDAVAEAVAQYPDRFLGFAFVTPHYPEEMVPELNRAFDTLGMKGLKIYPPYFNQPVTDEVWAPVFEFCNARGIPVISHSWGGDAHCGPKLFAELAGRYPQVPFVLGHAGGGPEGWQEAIEAAQKAPNVYLEICGSARNPGSIELLVEGAGEDRVLFGSDNPLLDPRIQLGRIVTSTISETAKRKVLGENAARILGLNVKA